MSSIKNISASNPVPNDLAKRLGNDGIGVILATLWLGYKDLHATGMVRADTDEDTITVEWYLKVYNRWTSENRASQVNVNLIPTNQYPDVTVKKKRGKASFLRENPVENTGERVENPFFWGKPVEFHCVFPFFLRTAAI